jgi:hypothetical protein
MKKILLFVLFLSAIMIAQTTVNCNNGPSLTLSEDVDEEHDLSFARFGLNRFRNRFGDGNGNPKTSKDKCQDRQVCYTSCKSVFRKNNCSTRSFGILIEDNDLYNKACKIRSKDGDSLFSYISKMKFGGSLIKRDNPSLFKYFEGKINIYKKEYIAEIRAKDW